MDLETARINESLIAAQEQFDGIHVIETSLSSPASEVVRIYKNLWRIEDSFPPFKKYF